MIGLLMMRVSVVLLSDWIALEGIEMGVRQDFALAPAHAHLNLVGGVLLFVFGLYYRLVPGAGASALAKDPGLAPYRGGDRFPAGRRHRASARGASIGGRPDHRARWSWSWPMALFAVIVFRTTRA